uniref:Uncharacterized protein n=1 Tax=Romanomermis culicivorax TaxID=13658 RepID=A0A915J7U5_ROMCU
MPEFLDDPLVKCQCLSLQHKTKLVANRELSTCFEEAKACKEHYAQMAILDCNVAIAPAIDQYLHLFLEQANKWPVLTLRELNIFFLESLATSLMMIRCEANPEFNLVIKNQTLRDCKELFDEDAGGIRDIPQILDNEKLIHFD